MSFPEVGMNAVSVARMEIKGHVNKQPSLCYLIRFSRSGNIINVL